MKINSTWQGKMKFTATDGKQSVLMDAKSPIGDDSALSPKQLMLAGICGCTAMDVVSLLKKYKQELKSLTVESDAPLTEGKQPAVFTRIDLHFIAEGAIDSTKLLEAVQLSQTKFCGVSAMVSKAVPIFYKVSLNGSQIGEGQAHFEF